MSARSGGPLDLDETAQESPFGTDEAQRYERGGRLGQGGMGHVDLSRDVRLDRDVAVKTASRHGAAAAQALEREARLTARLQHPNIVPVLEAGVGADGRPYYTMPVLEGRSLADALAEGDALRLVRHVLGAAWALAYAHEQGVVHRDVKPSNILVGRFGETRVADWGLACTADEAPQGVGTAGYMAPEQAESVSPALDVYSLGAVLREVVGPDGPPELLAVAAKATAADPQDRYPSARRLAEDLEAWLDGRRVAAHDYGAAELLWRFVRTWRAPLFVASLGVVALAAAVAWGWTSTVDQRDRALEAEGLAQENLARALVAQAGVHAASGQRGPAEVLAAHALRHLESPQARGVLARFGGRPSWTVGVQATLPECVTAEFSPDASRLACVTATGVSLFGDEGRVDVPGAWDDAAFFGDEVWLSTLDGRMMHWDGAPQAIGDHEVAARGLFTGLSSDRQCFLARGDTVCWPDQQPLDRSCLPSAMVLVRTGLAHDAMVCDSGQVLIDGQPVATIESAAGGPSALAWSRTDPERMAVGTLRGQVLVYQQGALAWQVQVAEHGVTHLALEGQRMAVGLTDGTAVLYLGQRRVGAIQGGAALALVDGVVHVAADRWLTRQPPAQAGFDPLTFDEGVASVDWSPDGQSVAVALGSGAVVHVGVDGAVRQTWQLTRHVAKDVAFSPDGHQLALALIGTNPRVVDLHTGAVREVDTAVWRRVAWFGGALLGGSYDPGLRVNGQVLGLQTWYAEMDAGPNHVVLLDREADLWRWDGTLHAFPDTPATALSVAATDDGAVVGTDDGRLVRVDADGQALWEVPVGVSIVDVDVHEGRVAAGRLDGTVEVRTLAEGRLLAVLEAHDERAARVRFSPDGAWLATGSWDRSVRFWWMGELEAPADVVVQTVEERWQTSLQEVLGAE